MREQDVTVTIGYGQFFCCGTIVHVGGTAVRVLRVDGDTLTVRRLRWYERAWLFITARLKP
jgi:hypothetical protein